MYKKMPKKGSPKNAKNYNFYSFTHVTDNIHIFIIQLQNSELKLYEGVNMVNLTKYCQKKGCLQNAKEYNSFSFHTDDR